MRFSAIKNHSVVLIEPLACDSCLVGNAENV